MSDTEKKFWARVRRTFVRGAAIIIPVTLTVWFFQALLNVIDGILSPVFEAWLGRQVTGLGFVSMIVLVLFVGLVSRNLFGRVFFNYFEKMLRSIPFVRGVYGAIKDLVSAFSLGEKGRTFREVVLVSYPRQGLYTIAFVTNEMTYVAADASRIELLNIYIPSPPNPTSGVLILVPKKDAIRLNLTIEQGMKLVLSGGIVTPEQFAERTIPPT